MSLFTGKEETGWNVGYLWASHKIWHGEQEWWVETTSAATSHRTTVRLHVCQESPAQGRFVRYSEQTDPEEKTKNAASTDRLSRQEGRLYAVLNQHFTETSC